MDVTSEPELRCYIRHMRAVGLCHSGSRMWCEANGIDWKDFVKNGIPVRVLRDSGDPIVARLVTAAEEEKAKSDGR